MISVSAIEWPYHRRALRLEAGLAVRARQEPDAEHEQNGIRRPHADGGGDLAALRHRLAVVDEDVVEKNDPDT